VQGFTGVDQKMGAGFDAFAFVRAWYDGYFAAEPGSDTAIFLSDLPDRPGIQQVSFLLGAAVGEIDYRRADGMRSGLKVGLSWEAAPPALSAAADFQRLDANLTAFVPVVSTGFLTLYAAERFAVDCLYGGHVPLNAKKSFCGWAGVTAFCDCGVSDWDTVKVVLGRLRPVGGAVRCRRPGGRQLLSVLRHIGLLLNRARTSGSVDAPSNYGNNASATLTSMVF